MNKEKSRKGKKRQEEKDDTVHHEIIEEVLSISGAASNDEDDEKKVEKPVKKSAKIKNKKEVSQSTGNETVPRGWRKEVVVRKSGKTAGQHDVYFYSPEGTKLRSKPDVASYISKNKLPLKIEQFDFSKEVVSKKAAKPKSVPAAKPKSVPAAKPKSVPAAKQGKEGNVKESQKEVAKPVPKSPKNVARKITPAVNSVAKKKEEESSDERDADVVAEEETEEAPRKIEVFQVRPLKKRRTRV